MKVLYITLGCKVNQYETESIRETLQKEGFSTVQKEESPDILILNSCTVTAESDRKARKTIRHYKKLYPDIITLLLGCMPSAFPKKAEETEADIIFGNTDHSLIPSLLKEFLKNRKRIIKIEPHETGEEYKTPSICSFSERTRAYMKIEDGCNRFCSYCAIPYARGRVRSRALEDIKKEACALSKAGYKEIVLVGINLSAFGNGTDYNLCDAVELIAKEEGIKRIRLGSLEPDHITDEMLLRLKAVDKFCPQFHLSLQSGANETLKRMNRHYTAEFYKDLTDRIKKIFPDSAITTDIMVGFHGETEEEFNESLNFMKSVGFARCHVFSYSEREGTNALKLKGRVLNSEKQRRAGIMISEAEKSLNEFLKGMLNKTEDLLLESYKDGFFEGYTANYTRVFAKGNGILGEIVPVKLEKINGDIIEGKIIGVDNK